MDFLLTNHGLPVAHTSALAEAVTHKAAASREEVSTEREVGLLEKVVHPPPKNNDDIVINFGDWV